MAKTYMKRFKIINHYGNANKNHHETFISSHYNGYPTQNQKVTKVGKDMGQRYHTLLVV